MKFMLIAYATKNSEAGLPPDPRLMAAIGKLSEDMAKAGVLVTTGGLAHEFDGRAHAAVGRQVDRDRWAVHRGEGDHRRLRRRAGEVQGRGHRIGQTFWQIHADILGPSYVGEGEVRQLFDPTDFNPHCNKD